MPCSEEYFYGHLLRDTDPILFYVNSILTADAFPSSGGLIHRVIRPWRWRVSCLRYLASESLQLALI
jgi:hypothetical protein